ncbi:MAG: UDP-N-acetylglucosamine 2-epimerase (non-hydrolyzing) [Ignavibacteriae bacterium]|nr:MAG: UDP-N-acetylglucosamine 2-epimerase (non-hydrolyzing) [Ignavibacteriota bacterium]
MKIISVVGARPNFMKLAPIALELNSRKDKVIHKVVHTGQHYDYKLSKVFFKDLHLPKPDFYLGIGSGSHADQTARIMEEFEKVVLKVKPDIVIVFGDVNSTLACSVVCSKIIYNNIETIPVAHVEAGLRSFDRTMPEEINRIVTDSISKYLFITEKAGVDNLRIEGVDKNRTYLTGDVMIDSLVMYRDKFGKSKILKQVGVEKDNYFLMTIHRPVNVDTKDNLSKILSIINRISSYIKKNGNDKIVFPVHPRTLKMMDTFGMLNDFKNISNLKMTEPVSYLDFIKLLTNAKFVMTDSGGVQEEATFLRIPCLTLRSSFERPETISIGTNTLCGLNTAFILKKVKEIYSGTYKKGKIPRLMDGKAAKRIADVLLQNL